MHICYKTIAALMMVLALAVGCGKADPTATPTSQSDTQPSPAATTVPPSPTDTLIPEIISTSPASTPAIESTPAQPAIAEAITQLVQNYIDAGLATSLAGSGPAESGYAPVFEQTECRFDVPAGYAVECGDLIVPEDRSQLDSPLVKLHVAVFKSRSPEPHPDPVFYLAGGGGANVLDSAEHYLRRVGDDILKTRDFVLYNQRGTRHGEPNLDCPGYTQLLRRLAGQRLGRKGKEIQIIAFLLDCRDGLLESGINLTAYNTAANAADVNDLHRALGYDQINLYGASYGSKLALAVMRDYPEIVRSAIVDSVFPPQVGYYTHFAQNAHRAFDSFFEECATDPGCSQTYPNLEAVFYRVVDELDATPVTLMSRQEILLVDGGDFMNAIYSLLYYAEDVNLIPLLIYRAGAGHLSFMKDLFAVPDQSHISWGTHYSMLCHDDAAFETYEEAVTQAADLPLQITDYYVSPFIFELCESWQAGKAAPADNEPVISDIPTLVLAGQYDPITPPAWSRLAAETLSNSFYYEFPGRGHGVLRSDRCGLEIGLAFLDAPTIEPDTSCLASASHAESK